MACAAFGLTLVAINLRPMLVRSMINKVIAATSTANQIEFGIPKVNPMMNWANCGAAWLGTLPETISVMPKMTELTPIVVTRDGTLRRVMMMPFTPPAANPMISASVT